MKELVGRDELIVQLCGIISDALQKIARLALTGPPQEGMERLRCKICGHRWYRRRKKLPRVCPKCKRFDWYRTRRG